jgi:hypothetical protein
LLEKSDDFIKQVKQGKAVYRLLGFSEDALQTFYQAASTLLQQDGGEMGRDVFFFLTQIGPEVADFWFGLAIGEAKLARYHEALESSRVCLGLNPQDKKVKTFIANLEKQVRG